MKTLTILLLTLATGSFAQKKEFYQQVNEIRRELNLPALKRSLKMEITSKLWLLKIRRERKMYHDRSKNIYEVLTAAPEPIWSFMGSKPHKDILLTKNATHIGVAFYKGRTCARLD